MQNMSRRQLKRPRSKNDYHVDHRFTTATQGNMQLYRCENDTPVTFNGRRIKIDNLKSWQRLKGKCSQTQLTASCSCGYQVTMLVQGVSPESEHLQVLEALRQQHNAPPEPIPVVMPVVIPALAPVVAPAPVPVVAPVPVPVVAPVPESVEAPVPEPTNLSISEFVFGDLDFDDINFSEFDDFVANLACSKGDCGDLDCFVCYGLGGASVFADV